MAGRSCAVVVVGRNTANRKWINHEIVKAWDDGLGVVGIHIHGLKNKQGLVSRKGLNPFDFVTYGPTGRPLSSLVHCYDPSGANSQARYAWIEEPFERCCGSGLYSEEALPMRR